MLGHHLLDNPKIAIDFTSVSVIASLSEVDCYILSSNQAPSAWKTALDMSAKILEKRKSVLNHLGRARKCVETPMGFGMVASSVS